MLEQSVEPQQALRVPLNLALSDGTSKEAQLTNVLYSSHLKCRLFSWSYVHNTFDFTLFGTKNELCLLHSGNQILQSRINRNLFETELAKPEAFANTLTYTDFHNAFGYTKSMANQLYEDPHQVPVKPKDFDCEGCHLSKSTHSTPKILPA